MRELALYQAPPTNVGCCKYNMAHTQTGASNCRKPRMTQSCRAALSSRAICKGTPQLESYLPSLSNRRRLQVQAGHTPTCISAKSCLATTIWRWRCSPTNALPLRNSRLSGSPARMRSVLPCGRREQRGKVGRGLRECAGGPAQASRTGRAPCGFDRGVRRR